MLLLAAGCAGCTTVGPDYRRPEAPAATTFKEAEGWKTAQPADQLPRGPWWSVFSDARLASLMERVDADNPGLQAAQARIRQAESAVRLARSEQTPTVTASVSTPRSRSAFTVSAPGGGVTTLSRITTNHQLSAGFTNWEIDLWGRIARTIEASEATLQAASADMEALRLSSRAQLADAWYQLRAADAQKDLLERTATGYEQSLSITRNRYTAGVAARTDVTQAETQLKSTQAQAIDVGIRRAQLEHAVAALVGTTPAAFSIPPLPLAGDPPALPLAFASELLERRPDIAAAERRVASANAQIGVAEAAFYPAFTFSVATGLQSLSASNWLRYPSRFWSVGPALSTVLFDRGARRAESDRVIAAYDETVADYRQIVLQGFQEVEDQLIALRALEVEARVNDEAMRAARDTLALTLNQYKAGTVSYLNVVTAQAAALTAERTAIDILGRRYAASVGLIRALGGGWNDATR